MVNDDLHVFRFANNGATARCEQSSKNMDDIEQHSVCGSCRIMLKSCDVGMKSTSSRFGSVIKVLPGSNVEIRLDDNADNLTVALECIRPIDAGSAVELAKSFFHGGFKPASAKFVQNLCTDCTSSQEILLQVSEWLIANGDHEEAEALLRRVLKVDPSVTSGDHLRALRALADLKSLLGLHDEAICLLEAVLQNDPDARSEHTASALLRLARAYTELGQLAEASTIRALLQRAADARPATSVAGGIAVGATAAPPAPFV
jgi:tetratricopeptide (TPR) repeat protein